MKSPSSQPPSKRGPKEPRKLSTEEYDAQKQLIFQANLMACVQDALIATDLNNTITYWNPGAKRMFEYSAQEALGQPVSFLFPPDLLSLLTETIQPQVTQKGWYQAEVRLCSKSGKVIPVHLSLATLKDDQGVVIGMTGSAIDITERKRVELALRESEQKFQVLAELAPVGIFRTDRDGKTLYVNPQWSTISGLPFNDALDDKWLKAVHPQDREMLAETWKKAVAQRSSSHADYRFMRQDGSLAWVVGHTIPQVDLNGEITGYIGTIIDITERKQAEEDIRRHNEELSALNSLGRQISRIVSPDEMISNTLRSLVEAVHPDAAFFFQRQAEELILKDIQPQQARIRLQDMPGHLVGECICGLAVSQGRPLYSIDIFQDMRCTWQECKKAGMRSFAALPLHSGKEVIGIIGLASDTVRDFEAQAAFLETLADQVSIGINNAHLYEQIQRQFNELNAVYNAGQSLHSLHSPEHLAQEIIQVMENIVGYEYGSVLLIEEGTQRLVPFAHSAQGQSAEFVETDKKFIASRAPKKGEGITGWVAQNGQSLRIGDVSQDERYIAVRKDIHSELCVALKSGDSVMGVVNVETTTPDAYTESDQRLLETIAAQISVAIQNARLLEEVQRYAKELEQRVAERTADLEAKSLSLETFTYTVSHDLKAPLRGIDGYSRLLLEDHAAKLDEEGRQFLFNVRHAAGQMNDLIDDLLQYSRLERRNLTLGEINLPELVKAILAEHADEIQERHIKVSVRIPFEKITADIEGLTQALRNLVDNALKFSVNTPRPVIKIIGHENEKGYIIEIHDNGIGIDPQYQERIFEIFQRLHRVEEYPGSGVGLAIVHKAMERMGGRVWVESIPGQGATFYLEVPK